jgi:hypothetical protein
MQSCKIAILLLNQGYALVTWNRTLTYLLTHSIEQSPSSETNQFLASQEIPCISWSHNVHYRKYKYMPPVPILNQINPVHASKTHFPRSILILSSYLCQCPPSGLSPSGFPTKIL